MKKRRKSPIESIENSDNPAIEHAFIKYPRENPIDVSGFANESNVYFDNEKIHKASAGKSEEEIKKKMKMHTHPFNTDKSGKYGQPMYPSGGDMSDIFASPEKTHVIAYRDRVSGKVGGYLIMRKLKSNGDFEKDEKRVKGVQEYSSNLREVGAPGLKSIFNVRVKGNYQAGLQKGYDLALKKASETIGFKYKYVPAEGYEFNMDKGGLVKKVELARKLKPSEIEKIAVTASIISFLISTIFLSTSITGYAIADLSAKSSSWIGAGLFVIGLITGFFWLRKK